MILNWNLGILWRLKQRWLIEDIIIHQSGRCSIMFIVWCLVGSDIRFETKINEAWFPALKFSLVIRPKRYLKFAIFGLLESIAIHVWLPNLSFRRMLFLSLVMPQSIQNGKLTFLTEQRAQYTWMIQYSLCRRGIFSLPYDTQLKQWCNYYQLMVQE